MPVLSDVLQAMDQDYRDRLDNFQLYRDYLDGKHRFDWASSLSKSKIDWALRTAQENLCPAIVDIYCDKIAVDDWGVDETSGIDTEALDRLLAMVAAETHGMGNGFVIVWRQPNGEIVPVFQRADQCIPVVDEEQPDRLRYLAKVWRRQDGRTRLNIYDDQALYRLISRDKHSVTVTNGSGELLTREGDWLPFDDAERNLRAVEPHDFGVVPACWFKRKAADPFAWGASVLRDAIPAQDELNKVAADTLVSSERVALPLRYIMEVAPELLEPKLNPTTGQLEPPKLPFDEKVNSILALTAKGPAGQFAAPDAASLIKLQEHAESKMFRVTGIPSFYLLRTGGDAPSGISLRILSSRLTSAVKSFTRDNTPTLRGLLQLMGVTNPVISWADPMPLSAEEMLADAAEEKALGLPVEEWLRTAGYDPDETDERGLRLAERVQLGVENIARQLRQGDIGADLYGMSE